MPDFAAALKLTLRYEGGKVDDSRDPGGRTAYGVTQLTFDSWCSSTGVKPRDVFTITPAEVEAVYRHRYADTIRFDDLPDGVGFCLFDAAVNSGPKTAVEWLQAALGTHVDGAIGPATIAAAKGASAFVTINAFCDHRLAFLRRLTTWSTFGKGWAARVEDVRKSATAMAHAAGPAMAAIKVDVDKPELASIETAINKAAASDAVAHVALVVPKPIPVHDALPAVKSDPSVPVKGWWAWLTRRAA